MKKIYINALRRYFEGREREFAPGYEFMPMERSHMLHGGLVYVKKLSASDWAYICVRLSPKGYDEYDFEIGWSRLGRVPETSMRAAEFFTFASPPETEKRLNVGLPPRGGNWQFERPTNPLPHQREKLTSEIAQSVVEPIVEESIQQLIRVGLPILKQFESYVEQQNTE